MKKMKKLLALLTAIAMLAAMTACGTSAASNAEASSAPAEASTAAEASAPAEETSGETYNIGICQLVQHDALDAATQGFKDALTAKLGDKVTFDEQNASGDSANCSTIINGCLLYTSRCV